MKRFRKYIGAFVISGLLISGGLFLGGEEAFAKQVIKTSDHKRNKITGKRGDAFNNTYVNVPSSAYLNSTPSVKISSGVIHDTYKTYWIYYSSSTGKYYP